MARPGIGTPRPPVTGIVARRPDGRPARRSDGSGPGDGQAGAEAPHSPGVYHEVDWNPETIQRFWDYYGANPAAADSYFSKKFGARIVGMARAAAPLAGPVVDLGCGPGFLTEELLAQGFETRAIDSSPRSIDEVRARLGGHPGFLGADIGDFAKIPLPDGSAGAVFLIEVLEHVSSERRDEGLREIARVLRPGGHLVATTPNEEDLDAKKIACPECGCVFHRVQHLESLDAATVSALLDRHGFDPIFVRGVNFRHFPDRPLGRLVRLASHVVSALRDDVPPHLLAVGRRRAR